MPTNRELEVILRLRDELSKTLDGVRGNLKKFSNHVRDMGAEIKHLGKEVGEVGQKLTLFGAAITGPFVVALNTSKDLSFSVHDALNRLKNVTEAFQVSIAESVVPVVNRFINILNNLLNAFNALNPATRQQILQATLMSGVFLTLGGIFIKIVGDIMKLTGNIMLILSNLSPVKISIMAIVAAIALMIAHWEKVRDVAMPILNGIEIGANMVAIGFHKMIGGMIDGLINLSNQWAEYLRIVGRVPGPQQQVFLNAAAGLDQVSSKLRLLSTTSHATVQDLQNNMQKIFVTGSGNIASTVETAKVKLDELDQFIRNMGKDSGRQMVQNVGSTFKIMEGMAQQTANALTTSFSNLFFNLFQGKLRSLKEVFADFGRSILQILAQALARLVLMNTIGRMFPAMGAFFHSGGIVRAHSGMLARDEIPAILQTGEGVLSRKGMNALGGADNLRTLNEGKSIGGGVNLTVHVNQVIQAWDASDVWRNRKTLSSAIAEDIYNNGKIRSIIKNYT